MTQITIIEQNDRTGDLYIDRAPDMCPHCHKSIAAQRQHGYRAYEKVEVIFRCPDNACRRLFIGYYDPRDIKDPKVYLYKKASLGTIKTRDFSDNIKEVSTSFIEIYNQAIVAEGHGLDHVSGIGLRKALEFLIKDYLITKNPEQTEQIQKKMLGPCIKDHLDNPNIKDMAERAVWLGNDHTHYVKKWKDKDILDLKFLIDITLHWIEMEVLTKKYKTDMS